MADFSDFIQSVRADGNNGKAFEVFAKWFLKNDPEWSTQVDQVWLWDDWPDKWGPDCGIDLVFQHKNGDIWAVQAKCYGSNYYVTKKDMDTFLSESNRAAIQKRLLMASTDLMSPNAIRTCNHQEKPVTRFMLTNFEDAAVEYPSHISELNRIKPKEKPRPRKHQKEAIQAIAKGFREHDREQLIMACGTGKTFTTLWIKEQIQAETTLVLLPSLSLLSQTLREWTAACNQTFEVLCVCSDKSVGRKTEDMHVSEAPFPVTSETEEIRGFLKADGPKVVFCTYQSSDLVAQVQADADIPNFDLVVADEAHRCAGNAEASFSRVLNGNAIRAKKRLFTTATPRVYTSSLKKRAEERGIEMYGMDDAHIFGPELHKLSFGEAIERDLLTNYQVVIVGVDEPMVKQWIDQQEIVSANPDTATDARSLASKIGLIKAIKDYDLERVISFHSRVKSARDFSRELSDIVGLVEKENRPKGSIWTDYVSGDMSAGDRTTKIRKLKDLGSDDRGLLTNARCLSEGVDVPALDGVAFIDPKGSQVDIIQAVGRAIRKSDKKEKGTIVIPVFIEDGDDVEAKIDASNFKPVWDVVKALRSHDEVLAGELDQYRTNMAKGTGANSGGLSDKIIIDLPLSVDVTFSSALRTVLVEATTASWEYWYGLLEDYVERESHALVPDGYKTTNGYNLGSWVSIQRQRKDKLSSDRLRSLEALEGWDWDPFTTQWEEGCGHLEDFVEMHGHARVPSNFKTSNDYNLGRWVIKQRVKKDRLPEEKRARLGALEGWTWNTIEWQWEEGCGHLEDFVEMHGHARVPSNFKTSNDYNLGTWVSKQRAKKDRLPEEKRARLEALEGWDWYPFAGLWEEGCGHLADFVKQHGHARVPDGYKTADGFTLGRWVARKRFLKDKLPPEKRSELEAMEGWIWDYIEWQWDEGYRLLKNFVEKSGNARVPKRYKTAEGYNLGSWVSTQRGNRDRLSQEKRSRLESVEGWDWDPFTTQWEEGFGYLIDFVKQNGHARVLTSYKAADGYRLGAWASRQRQNRDKISPDRRSRLEALEGWVW